MSQTDTPSRARPTSRAADPAAVVPRLATIPSEVIDGARRMSHLEDDKAEDKQVLARAIAAKFFAKDGVRFHGFMASRYAAAGEKAAQDVTAGRSAGLSDAKLSGLTQAAVSFEAMSQLHKAIREDIQVNGKLY